jgi:hypothetical protein
LAQQTDKADSSFEINWASFYIEILEYQKVHDVIIRNNIERGSANGGFTVFAGQHITLENNDMENRISFSFGSNIKILNNTFNASEVSKFKPGIAFGAIGERVFNNLISGNTINGYGVAIYASFKDAKIVDNIINDCSVGINFKTPEDMEIHGNKITSSVDRSRGFYAHLTTLNNVNIYDNEISVDGSGFAFTFVNLGTGEENYINTISNNISPKVGSDSGFSKAKGINFTDNIINGSLWVSNTSDFTVSNNVLNTSNNHGILLKGINFNLKADNNQISYNNEFECIYIEPTNDLNELSLVNNDCN